MTPEQATAEDDQFDAGYEEANPPPDNTEAEHITASLGQRLLGEYEKRRTDRREIEQRWLRDARQYNGVYEKEFADALKERKAACKVFVPLTRRISNIVEARLGDLLFPTDDRNFVVEASPKPELDEADNAFSEAGPNTPVNVDGVPMPASKVAAAIGELIDEAKRRAANMQRTVDDQLTESDWPSEGRKIIHDGVKLGSGVAKGPFVLNKTKKKWSMTGGVPQLVIDTRSKPTLKRVDPWNFFPDLSVSTLEESQSFYELIPLNKLDFVGLVEQGFDRDAIIRVLESGGKDRRDSTIDELREAAGTVGIQGESYNVVEFNGYLDAQDLIDCGCDIEDDQTLVFSAIVWFHEGSGEVLKAAINPMKTENIMYSVFNWQPDSACVFGYGLPHEIRDIQDSVNSSYRAAHDNAGLSVGPQIVVNSKKIQPMNGSWAVEPNKLWDLTDSSTPINNVFGFFQIESRLNDLLALFNLNKQLAEEIGGPMLAMQGQDAPSYVQTATGMSIAYNSASIWMRRAVKLWDDQITVPRISAFIDWNMEHNPDDDIKGDLNAVARGTSALLEAEGQVQRLQLLSQASSAAGIPVRKMVNQLRQMALSMRLDPDELLPSDDEIKEMEANAAPPPNPEMERIRIRDAEIADKQADRDFQAAQTAENNRIRMIEIASRENLTIAQVKERYGFELAKMDKQHEMDREKQGVETQRFNAELLTKARQGSGI